MIIIWFFSFSTYFFLFFTVTQFLYLLHIFFLEMNWQFFFLLFSVQCDNKWIYIVFFWVDDKNKRTTSWKDRRKKKPPICVKGWMLLKNQHITKILLTAFLELPGNIVELIRKYFFFHFTQTILFKFLFGSVSNFFPLCVPSLPFSGWLTLDENTTEKRFQTIGSVFENSALWRVWNHWKGWRIVLNRRFYAWNSFSTLSLSLSLRFPNVSYMKNWKAHLGSLFQVNECASIHSFAQKINSSY